MIIRHPILYSKFFFLSSSERRNFRSFIYLVILAILHIVRSNEQTGNYSVNWLEQESRISVLCHLDKHLSSLATTTTCNINRADFGQLKHVQITYSSIQIHFENHIDHYKCPTISISALITNSETDQIEREIRVRRTMAMKRKENQHVLLIL